MKTQTIFRLCIAVAAAWILTPAHTASAADYTWTPTAAGTTYDWLTTNQNNWGTGLGGAFPNGIGDVANINIDITGAQTIRLAADVMAGVLNIGDLEGTSNITINSTGAPTKVLTLQNATGNAAINLGPTGAATNSIGANVFLGSNLDIVSSLASSQKLTTSGLFDTNGKTINVVGGANQVAIWSITGDLVGNGPITFTGLGGISIGSTVKSYTGSITLNGTGRGGTDANSGVLTTTTGSLKNAAQVTINGAFSGNMVAAGGTWHSGNGSAAAANPGQRFTEHRIVLNSGWLDDGGQAAATVLTADVGTGTGTDIPWRRAEEFVRDDLEAFRLNSGYSLIVVNSSNSTAGTIMDVDALERSFGASVFMRSSTWATKSRFTIGNSAALLKGDAGAEGTTTMSIIPWMAAGAATSVPAGFATYGVNGVRPLVAAGELNGSIQAGSIHNVSTGTLALTSDAAVNSLTHNTSGVSNIGTDRTLAVASGGIFFTNSGGSIGAAGVGSAAGTLQFGEGSAVEGVVWSNGTNTNGIGASITGTGGFSKAGTGTLVLTGINNTYTGPTYVGGGTLQVGDGLNLSTLGLSGDVKVANGATLSLMNGLAIADTATLTLESFGLFNGRLNLGGGVDETVGALYLGELLAPAGTYGSSLSTADNRIDSFFSGSGVLTVVPEPGSAGLLLGGVAMLAGRRRRE